MKDKMPKIAFVGGGNMAWALGAGIMDKGWPPTNLHVVDTNPATHAHWLARGASATTTYDARLAECEIWFYALKPQVMRKGVAASRAWLRADTLVISVAAGIRSGVLANWLGSPAAPFNKLVRCMPNTPALVGQGISGNLALAGVSAQERARVAAMLATVGQVIWVKDDAQLDAVTALSGSGPAYVFLFIEALIAGGQQLGLQEDDARTLALATLTGTAHLAHVSSETPCTLRERVTSKGGTTAAALQVLEDADFRGIIAKAMAAADKRSRELAAEFGADALDPPS